MSDPPKPEVVKLLVANGAMLEAPIYNKQRRGSNWCAVIDVDKTMPAGLSRRWLDRGRGECLYSVEQLDLFDPVEFAADHISPGGEKRHIRWYGIVVAKTDGCIMLEKCSSGARAVLRAREAHRSSSDRVAALKAQHDAHIIRAAEIEAEIRGLQEPDPPPDGDVSVQTNR